MWASKKRRKQRERVLDLWRSMLAATLSETRTRLGLGVDERIPDEILLSEAVDLARSDVLPDREAIIPAPRVDLADRWFEARLSGQADTEAQRLALARELAPRPDLDLSVGPVPWGISRESVERAVEYFARRR